MGKGLSIILIAAFAAFVYVFGLGEMALTDPDEPFYAETAKEMYKRGEWLTPRIFGEPQFEKPALYYWLVVLSYKIFGVNEFAARFPSAIFGILGVIGVYFLGTLLFNRRTGLFSALVAATSVEYMVLSRACVTDVVLCVFVIYTFLFFLAGYSRPLSRFPYYLSALSAALAVLTKGPVGLVLPLFVILLFLVIKRDLKSVFKMPILFSVFVFVSVSAPWYVLMYLEHGAKFTEHFFGFQNVTRFITPEHTSGDIAFYYLPVLLVGFLPWTIFLPSAYAGILREDRAAKSAHLFLFLWAAVFLVFFSISRTKLPTYIFPMFPALSVVAGRYFDILHDRDRWDLWDFINTLIYFAVFPAAIVAGYMVAAKKYPAMAIGIVGFGTCLIALASTTLISMGIRKRGYYFGSIVLTMGVGVVPLTYFMANPLGFYESSKPIAEALKAKMQKGDLVAAETDYRRGVAFYLDREYVPDIHSHDKATKYFRRADRVWGILKDKNHSQLYTDVNPFDTPTYLVEKMGKRVIVSNKLPDDGKFVKMRSRDEPE